MIKLQKAKKIRDIYKQLLLSIPHGKKLPPYFYNWTARLLRIEYLIIDLRYNIKPSPADYATNWGNTL